MRRPLLAVCLCLVFLAALRLWGSGSEKIPEGFASTSQLDEKEPLTVTGWVYRKENETVYLKNVSIANLQKEIPLKENIICEWKEAELPLLGSLIKVTGVYRRFSEASNPGEFDQRAYYRTLKIGGKLTNTKLLGAGRGYSRLTEALYRLKLYWKDRLYRILPEKEASVMSTMLLGEKAELDSSVKELYRRNGIVHILSISGVKTLKLDIPLVLETRINWGFVPLHIAIIYILKLCLGEEIIPRCRFPCSRGYLIKCINWQKKQSFSVSQSYRKS